jgi:hypothetical protein
MPVGGLSLTQLGAKRWNRTERRTVPCRGGANVLRQSPVTFGGIFYCGVVKFFCFLIAQSQALKAPKVATRHPVGRVCCFDVARGNAVESSR